MEALYDVGGGLTKTSTYSYHISKLQVKRFQQFGDRIKSRDYSTAFLIKDVYDTFLSLKNIFYFLKNNTTFNNGAVLEVSF